jgi:hypothetical protein
MKQARRQVSQCVHAAREHAIIRYLCGKRG